MPYSVITLVTPDKAKAGVTVPVKAYIKNTSTIRREFTATMGRADSTVMRFGAVHKWIAPNDTVGWSDSFLMPNKQVVVSVESWTPGKLNIWSRDNSTEYLMKLDTVILPPPLLPGVKLLARATRYVGLQVVEPVPVTKEVQLVARHYAEVDVAKELYVLARASQVVIPAFVGVTLLASAEQVVIAGDIGVIRLDARDVIVDAVGEPVLPPEPEVEVNWWLWGGLAVVAVVIIAAVVKK